MNTKRRPWLNGVILLTSLAGLVSGAAEKNDQAATDFYAYYTKLDYTPAAGCRSCSDRFPSMPPGCLPVTGRTAPTRRPGHPSRAIRWGKYADLVVNVAEGRQLGVQPGHGISAVSARRPRAGFRSSRWPSAAPDPLVPLLLRPARRGPARSGSSSTGGMCRTRPAS